MKKLYEADAFDIYSPTPSMEADRLLVWFAATTGQDIHGLDVVQAYLNAQAPRTEGQRIFVHYPKERKRQGYVLLLRKCLYGLRISARKWNETLSTALKTMKFRQLRTERCIFTRTDNKGRETIIIVHVDDLKIIGDYEAVRRGLEHQGIKVTDEGQLTTHLGIEYKFTHSGITIHQTKATLKMLTKYGYAPGQAKTASVPLVDDSNWGERQFKTGVKKLENADMKSLVEC